MKHLPPRSDAEAPRIMVWISLFVLFILWSNAFHSIAYFRRELSISAGNLVTLRYGPVVPFCLLYCLVRWRALRQLLARDWWKVSVMGILMIPGYNLTLNWGQLLVPPATASLIIATNPVFTLLLALTFLGERARWFKIVGMSISFLGIYLLLRSQHAEFGSTYIPFALVVLIAPLTWALATVIGKPITGRTDPLLLTFAATAIGSLPFTVALICGTGGVHEILAALPRTGWIALAHLSILCTIVGFAIWFRALRHLSAFAVSAFVFLNPPLTAAFGFIWKTEVFRWSTIAFGAVTLVGVALSVGLFHRSRRT